jgi:hypothetical protein
MRSIHDARAFGTLVQRLRMSAAGARTGGTSTAAATAREGTGGTVKRTTPERNSRMPQSKEGLVHEGRR